MKKWIFGFLVISLWQGLVAVDLYDRNVYRLDWKDRSCQVEECDEYEEEIPNDAFV